MNARHPIPSLRTPRAAGLRRATTHDHCEPRASVRADSQSPPTPSHRLDKARRGRLRGVVTITIAALTLSIAASSVRAEPSLDLVLEAQSRRIEMIERVAPSVVTVFNSKRQGGGSGVVINAEGYGLTNYHVVAGMLNTGGGLGGLSDAKLYELEVLGIDPTGDVAMFRLLGRDNFPYAELGDSDGVHLGDTAFAMGNPFSLSEDYSPTVTMGIVTGTHRYQMGVRGNLAYSDCIQTDAPINPGNSGGPLFNAAGKIIGINGRISVNTRGRFNVGFGYAISSNQIKRFIPALRAGLLARHGTLQATIGDRERTAPIFTHILPEASAHNAGVREGDTLLKFDGVPITSPNHFASILGTYPAGWHVPIELERNGKHMKTIARLDPIEPELRAPFEVDREVNLRQVKRVLGAHQLTVLNVETLKRQNIETLDRQDLGAWECTVIREDLAVGKRGAPIDRKSIAPSPVGGEKTTEHYRVSHDGVGPIRMRRIHEDGSPGAEIEYDDRTATRSSERQTTETPRNQAAEGSEDNNANLGLVPDERMVLAAMYVMQQRLVAPIGEMNLTDVTHAGGNALVHPEGAPRMMEIIDWPIIEDGVAGLWFDAQTFDLVRIEVSARDRKDRTIATIDLSNWQQIGGVRRPCTIDVRGKGHSYRDTLVDWSVGR